MERKVEFAKIRHYVTKTISEYIHQKLCRGDADGYIVRDIENRFFIYCQKTNEKLRYWEEHKTSVQEIKNRNKDMFRKKSKVFVTMTSWKARIMNCVAVIQKILDNTLSPYVVFLNLSLEEFPKRLDDLPKELVELSMKNPKVKINWIDGKNTKTMKKVIPILDFL